MSFRVAYHRLAAQEARKGEAWYLSKSSRQAERFRQAVIEAASRIADAPDSYPIEIAGFRSIRVKRFPYRLFYRIEGSDLIVVMAVAHTSRRPRYWRRRKPEDKSP